MFSDRPAQLVELVVQLSQFAGNLVETLPDPGQVGRPNA